MNVRPLPFGRGHTPFIEYVDVMKTQPSSKGLGAAGPNGSCLSYRSGTLTQTPIATGTAERGGTAHLKHQMQRAPFRELEQAPSTRTMGSTRASGSAGCECLEILRLHQLTRTIGLSRSTVYGLLDPRSPQFDPEFPRPIRLGTSRRGAIGWFKAEVLVWLRSRERLLPH